MALNTFKTALMYYNESDWEKLVDIKDYPDIGGAPDALETTTLSDPAHTYIPGIEGGEDSLEFTANYTKDDYKKIKELKGEEKGFAIFFGGNYADGVYTPNSDEGAWYVKGYIDVFVAGGEVNAVREMTIHLTCSTVISETDISSQLATTSVKTTSAKTTKTTTTTD